MQEVIYKCDQCKKVIGEKAHFSLQFAHFSGISIPPSVEEKVLYESDNRKANWKVKNSLQGRFLHFCNGTCLASYFNQLLKKTVAKELKGKK